MSHSPAPYSEAVFLFNHGKVTRELLYSEFEAILDGFIPLPDLASISVEAVYVQIGERLAVTGLVFFLVGFDDKGMVDRRWNVPLQQLLSGAGSGPDMGAGAIRLACYSQCPVAWHKKNLWDPAMQEGNNTFILLRDAVKANRLGFAVKNDQSVIRSSREAIAPHNVLNKDEVAREQAILEQRLHDYYTVELNKQVGLLTQEQGLHVATLTSRNQEKINALQQEHQQRLLIYQQKLQQSLQENKNLSDRNHHLKQMLDTQTTKVEGMREYFAHKLKAARQGESNQIQILQENFAFELETKINAATAELREMLDMREVELFYRYQNESTSREEIVQLKHDNQQLLKNGSDQLLSRLVKAGINLVAFLPGMGEVAIPLDDIGIYLENPDAYAAGKIGVSEAIYLAWLAHHQSPCCTSVDARGTTCDKSIQMIETPLEFHPGESDRCTQHQTIALGFVAEGGR